MHRKQRCHAARTNTSGVVAIDPFGPDGFGDTWDKQTCFDSDSDEDVAQWQEEFGEVDWSLSETRRRQLVEDEEKRAQKEKEKIDRYLADKARMMKKKAAEEAAKLAVGKAQAKAKERWDRKVESAEHCLCLAKPVQALQILYSLFADESFFDTIDGKEQFEIAGMAQALEIHYELQKSLVVQTEQSIADDQSLETEASNVVESTPSTVGGDTVEANHYSDTKRKDIPREIY